MFTSTEYLPPERLQQVASEQRSLDAPRASRRQIAGVGQQVAITEIDDVTGIELATLIVVEGIPAAIEVDIACNQAKVLDRLVFRLRPRWP